MIAQRAVSVESPQVQVHQAVDSSLHLIGIILTNLRAWLITSKDLPTKGWCWLVLEGGDGGEDCPKICTWKVEDEKRESPGLFCPNVEARDRSPGPPDPWLNSKISKMAYWN